MRLTWKDLVATALVAAVVVPCIGYVVAGSVPFIQDKRSSAGRRRWVGVASGATSVGATRCGCCSR
jgi:hypothetical protein